MGEQWSNVLLYFSSVHCCFSPAVLTWCCGFLSLFCSLQDGYKLFSRQWLWKQQWDILFWNPIKQTCQRRSFRQDVVSWEAMEESLRPNLIVWGLSNSSVFHSCVEVSCALGMIMWQFLSEKAFIFIKRKTVVKYIVSSVYPSGLKKINSNRHTWEKSLELQVIKYIFRASQWELKNWELERSDSQTVWLWKLLIAFESFILCRKDRV